jgi:hypothetical protein
MPIWAGARRIRQGMEGAMLTPFLALALALDTPARAAPAAPPPLSPESRALLRCSAAFALVAEAQGKGDTAALRWPALGTRGREFFVRALARVMDETGLDRAGITRLAMSEAKALHDRGETGRIMPSCLVMLEAAGL